MSLLQLPVSVQLKECRITMTGIQESRCREARLFKDDNFSMSRWQAGAGLLINVASRRRSFVS